MKALIEQRGALTGRMKDMIENIKAEERAFTEEESAEFNKIEADIKAIDATIEAEQRAEDALAKETETEERGIETMEMEVRAANERF